MAGSARRSLILLRKEAEDGETMRNMGSVAPTAVEICFFPCFLSSKAFFAS